LGAGDGNGLKKDVLVDEAAGDRFALFCETIILPEVEVFSYFWK